MSDRLSLFLAGLALAFLVGVVYVGINMPQRPHPFEYRLSVRTEASEGAVSAKGETNLPSGSRLAIYIDRLYRLKGADTWRAARVGQGEALVEGGKWEAEVPFSEEEWVREIADRVNRRQLDPVQSVQGTLRTTVVFSPFHDQDPEVIAALGPDFAGLADSEAALPFGAFWIMRQEHTARMPLRLEFERAIMARAGG